MAATGTLEAVGVDDTCVTYRLFQLLDEGKPCSGKLILVVGHSECVLVPGTTHVASGIVHDSIPSYKESRQGRQMGIVALIYNIFNSPGALRSPVVTHFHACYRAAVTTSHLLVIGRQISTEGPASGVFEIQPCCTIEERQKLYAITVRLGMQIDQFEKYSLETLPGRMLSFDIMRWDGQPSTYGSSQVKLKLPQ
jgi:hypothetical protein